jgi:hypothetical protein
MGIIGKHRRACVADAAQVANGDHSSEENSRMPKPPASNERNQLVVKMGTLTLAVGYTIKGTSEKADV